MPADRFRSTLRPQGEAGPERGFALALVVLLLFAILAAGAAGYRIVGIEALQSRRSGETQEALRVAQAGLQWFTGSSRGVVPDTSMHEINGGTAVVTTRKLATLSSAEDLFLITSRGMFADPRFPGLPAVRTVSQDVILKKLRGDAPLAPLVTTSGRVRVLQQGHVDGTDHATPGQCSGAPTKPLAGAVARSSVQALAGGTVTGVPEGLTFGSFNKVVEAVGVPWELYIDPGSPAEYDGTWPDFSSLPSAAYPVVRVDGDFSPDASRDGRGVLIVTGQLRIAANSGWHWQGIVLAGDLQDFGPAAVFTLEGMPVAGQGTAMAHWDMENGSIRYHSCFVAWAGEALAHLVPKDGGWWEEM